MYQALYRKYRPSTFDEVVGQDIIIRTLKNAIKNNKLTHAYLFTGPRGTGKTSTAKILAKTINCQKLNEFEPCNQCESCIQINNRQTTDIIEIDAASNNGVDEIRELKNKVNLVPSNSKYKVYIIDEVHMLSTGAFNALLKTLEEPPTHIIFILATTEPHKIPATILSRCQRFDFKKISVQKIIENLKKIIEKENIDIEEEAIKELAILSKGGARDSLSLLDQVVSYTSEKITIQDVHDVNGTVGNKEMKKIVENILKKDISNLLNIFDQLDDDGKNLIKVIEELVIYLRNILIVNICPQDLEKNNSIYDDVSVEKYSLLEYIKHFSKTLYEMKNSDNEKITLELSLIELIEKNNIRLSNDCNKIKENKEDQNLNKSLLNNNVVKCTQTKEIEKNESVKNEIEIKNSKMANQKEQTSKILPTEFLNQLVDIRINNALSCFNRQSLLEYKKKIEFIKKYLFDEEYGQWASLILDGELKAVGKEYLIFVYKDEPMAFLFNQNYHIIETILKEVYNTNIKVVATHIDNWNLIKQTFNSKSKIYKWIEEPNFEDMKEEKKTEKNEIENLFQEIIEYCE